MLWAARDRVGATGRQARDGRALRSRAGRVRSAFRECRPQAKEARPSSAGTGKGPRCGVCRGVCAGAVRRFCRIAKARRGSGETIPGGHSRPVRVSSHAARAFRALSKGAARRDRTAANGASLRSGDAGHGVLRQVRRAVYRLCARSGVPGGRAVAGRRRRNSKRSSNHRGIVLADPIGALAHLQLGRAYVVSGDRTRAKSAYQDFLTLWKDADADIPILKQAKAEYAKL